MSAAITAEQVKELRELTGAGMLDCRKALVATNGDLKAATAQAVIDFMAPVRQRHEELLADPSHLIGLLADGAAWSTSALALALDTSQRTVQRALVESEAAGRVRSIGRARARRWLSSPLAGFTTLLLLPASLPGG